MRAVFLIALGIVMGSTLSTMIAVAWTAPTASPPGNNVASPINTGTTSQLKNGTLGVNALGVFGNTILNGTNGDGNNNGVNSYLNFGATTGQSGYGIRDNNGTLEFKNSSDGSWRSLSLAFINLMTVNGITPNGLGQITSIKFADGTTQSTAAAANPWSINGSNIYYNGGNVGIGTNNPASPLTVNGTIESKSGGVKFPDGTTQSTAVGYRTLPIFSVNKGGANQGNVTNVAFVKITWPTVAFDTTNSFNTSASRYTPTVAGYYLLSATVGNTGAPAAYLWNTYIYKNGTYIGANTCNASTGGSLNCTNSIIAYANGTTDYFEVYVEQSSSGQTMTVNGATFDTYFTGMMINPTY